MKAKISVTLDDELLASLDRIAGRRVSRSAFIEQVLRDFVEERARQRRAAQETAAINRVAAELNAEMSDALAFQADIGER